MKRLLKFFPAKKPRSIFDEAERVFAEVCSGDTSAAAVYRDHPDIREQHWGAIEADLREITSIGYMEQQTRRLRDRFAQYLELLVTDHFYTNLKVDDRQIFSTSLGSSREVLDQNHYLGAALHYAYSSILESILFGKWNGGEGARRQLEDAQENFINACKAYCQLGMLIAQAKNQGRWLTEVENEKVRATLMLKEAARRALAGD